MAEELPPPAVKFPPPLVYLGFILTGFLCDQYLGVPTMDFAMLIARLAGISVALLGLAVVISGIMQFRKQDENPEPWTGSDTMVLTGIYSVTRNPMYLGMTFFAIGIGITFGSYSVIVLALVAALVIDRGVITKEEAYLEARFGKPYLDYKNSVRRWI